MGRLAANAARVPDDLLVSARSTWPMIRAMRANGFDSDRVLREVGIDPSQARDPEARVSYAQAVATLRRMGELTGDPAYALRLGSFARESDFGLFHHLGATAATARELWTSFGRYIRLHTDAEEWLIDEVGDRAYLHIRMRPGLSHTDQWLEATFATIRNNADRMWGPSLFPGAMCFRHSAPEYAPEYEHIFGGPIRFRAEYDAIIVPAALLDAPLPTRDSELHEMLQQNAARVLAERARTTGIEGRVRDEVLRRLPTGKPGVNEVAHALGVSRSTLNRRLGDEGTSFSDIVDNMRRDQALRYLNESDLPIGEITYLLGFADVTSFHRAFKRWTNENPGEYRRHRVRAFEE